jgi:hypothetical protein
MDRQNAQGQDDTSVFGIVRNQLVLQPAFGGVGCMARFQGAAR